MHFASGLNYFDTTAAAQKYYTKLLEPLCKEWELTRNELDILLFLHNNPEFDRAADIVAHRGMTKSHVSLSVSTLEARGILERRFSETDRRTAHLLLTEQGRIIAGEARALQEAFFQALYAGVTREELQIWEQATRKVHDNIIAMSKGE